MRALGVEGVNRTMRRRLQRLQNVNNFSDVRTNLCDRSHAVANGTLAMPDALSGLSLHWAAALYDDDWIKCDDDGSCEGFHVSLMDQLAQRAGFEYAIDGIDSANINDWTGFLIDSLRHYDGNLDWWVANTERIAMGARCPHMFLDMSIISSVLATNRETSVFDDFARAFVGPFRPMVYFWLVLITLATAGTYFVLEMDHNSNDVPPEDSRANKFLRVLFLATNEFVQGSEGFAPQTGFGRAVSVSFALFVLLNIANYTSMLTTNLVTSAQTAVGFESLTEAVHQGAALCVLEGTAMADYVTSHYPRADVVLTSGSPFLVHAAGGCDIVVSTKQPGAPRRRARRA